MRKSVVSTLFATALMVVSLAGCSSTGQSEGSYSATPAGAAATTEVSHSRGTSSVPSAPQRVVVFDLSSLDTLDALGVPVAGVAGRLFPKHLEKYKDEQYLNIGTLFEPDYEALNAAKPDLIIVGGRSAAKYDELAKLAPTIDMSVSDNDYLGSSKKNAGELAKLFGKSAELEQRLARLQDSVATLAEKAKDEGKALVILTTGGKMSAYGPGSRFGTIHTDFGFTPAVEKLNTSRHGEPISFEFIAKTNPDWLFVIDRDAAIAESGQSARAVLDNALVQRTTASQKGQIVYLDASNWYLAGGGLATLQAMADEITRALDGGPTPSS